MDQELCVALFTYASDEPGDLSFEAGETITIVKKEEDWWTGKIGGRIGVFPFDYVEVMATKPDDVSKVEQDIVAKSNEEDTQKKKGTIPIQSCESYSKAMPR